MATIENVVLIEPKSPVNFFSHARMPRLGLPILGAILKKMKIRVKIFCEDLAPIDWKRVSQANLVGISVLTNLAPRAYEIAAQVKKVAESIRSQIPVVMGGPHPTFLPDEALLSGADFVIRNEGEEILPKLIAYLRGKGDKSLKDILGVSFRDEEGEIVHNPDAPLIENLDAVPLPDFSLIEGSERINRVPIQTSRGCPYDCEFCSVVQMFGRKIRYRSPESIVEEFGQAPKGKHIFLVDDNFSANSKRVLVLLEAMRKAGIRREWSTQETVDIARKPEIMKLMRETGCIRFYVGLESFNLKALEEWGKHQTPEDVERAIQVIHENGFFIHGMFVLGADSDTPGTINKTVDSAIRCGVDTAQFFILVPPPGTRLYERIKKEGRIFDKNWGHFDGQHAVIWPKNMTPWQVQQLSIEASQRFYTYWRGVTWALKRKWRNSAFAFIGTRLIGRWLKENREYLEKLRLMRI